MRSARWRLVTAAVGAVGALGGALALPGSIAAASGSSLGPSAPSLLLQVSSATFTQNGQELVWHVRLKQRFWPAGLAGNRQSLCLLIERVATGKVWAELCVIGHGRHSTSPRLEYLKVTGRGPGPGHVVSATVTRPNHSEFTATFLPSAFGARYGSLRWQVSSTSRSAACTTAPSASACSELYPATPRLVRFHLPVLVGCAPSGSSLVYQGSSRRREIALTFDDGPWHDPPTSQFLAVLEREHVPATFFEIGNQISTYDPRGAIERRMLADGDMIGDHTWSHPIMTKLSPGQQRAQLESAAGAIRHATRGFTPCLWRPPYGAVNARLVSLARSLGLLTIMWNVDPRDWSLPGVGAIYSNVAANARGGAIVIQHFGGGPRSQTLAALPQEINTLRARGYRFVTVDQLLGLRLVYR